MADLPRRAVSRTARLAALPLGYAGRQALGLGKRIGGRPAEVVLTEIQQRTADQLFRTLGELKGGAMKLGQMLSVLEAGLPEELVAPYRAQLTRLQDAAPAMPVETVRDILADDLGSDWEQRLEIDEEPAAAASIGQVHRGRWREGSGPVTEVAVKVQYPGAGEALASDLRQLAMVARTMGPLMPGLDLKALVAELQSRALEELDYALEAEAQRIFAAAYADHPDIVVPDVVAVGARTLVTEWLESPASLAQVIADGSPAERDHYGTLLAQFLVGAPTLTGLLHADPHPGNFRVLPADGGGPGRLGVLDYGAVARLPDHGLPEPMGRLIRTAIDDDPVALEEGLRAEGFVRDRTRLDADLLLDYLRPFVVPATVERFRFTREWMRTEFERVNDPRSPGYTVALRLNLPPAYLLIVRTWLGGLGVLSQLDAEVPVRAILAESLPGFTAPPE